jgi:aryl-alcohol dehydrogenase-like predicted oxidoreductase
VVLATKFAGPVGEPGPMRGGASRRYIFEAVEASLRRLRTDYVDLYQQHFPDPKTPPEETMGALSDLVRQGKVRYVGHSNFTGSMATEAHYLAQIRNFVPFVSAQNDYSLLNRSIEPELVPACMKYGVGVLPYFPLASGMLTGKYRRGEAPAEGTRLAAWGPRGERMLSGRNFDVVEKLTAFAEGRGHTILELAFSWLASQPHVASVIAGATKPEQVAENVAAASWRLTAEELAEVDTITKG